MAGAFAIDVGDEDFERAVVAGSAERPVVVDFWAPWCGPCRALGPVLERLADEGDGAFLLAKVDVDRAPEVARRFGVRGIPAVKAFRDGRVVAEFVGAQSEAAVRRFLAGVVPGEADRLVDEGADFASRGLANAAEDRYRAALARDARHERARLGLAELLAGRGAHAEAGELLEGIAPGGELAARAQRLAAAIRMRTSDAGGDLDALRVRAAEAPGDAGARLAWGRALAAAGRLDEALAELLASVELDPAREEQAARRAMLDVFELLGDDPRVAEYRRRLARALFR